MSETSIDVDGDDIELFKSPSTSAGELQEHVSYMMSDAQRKAEVSIRNLNAEGRRQMEEAKDKEVDHV